MTEVPPELRTFLPPRVGDFLPPRRVGTCQVCRLPVTADQDNVMGTYHLACLKKLRIDERGATLYRTPAGGLVKLGAPVLTHIKTARRKKAREARERWAKRHPAPTPKSVVAKTDEGRPAVGPAGEETSLRPTVSLPEAPPLGHVLRFPDRNPFGQEGAFPSLRGTYR